MTPKGGLMVLGESQLRDNQNHPWKQLRNALNTRESWLYGLLGWAS